MRGWTLRKEAPTRRSPKPPARAIRASNSIAWRRCEFSREPRSRDGATGEKVDDPSGSAFSARDTRDPRQPRPPSRTPHLPLALHLWFAHDRSFLPGRWCRSPRNSFGLSPAMAESPLVELIRDRARESFKQRDAALAELQV